MCKHSISIAFLVVVAASSFAQVPDSLSFQGYLTDSAGIALDTTVDMSFRLYRGPYLLTEEVIPDVIVSNGRFDVILGESGWLSLGKIKFNQLMDIGIKIGDGSELVPRTPLLSVPYALGVRGMYSVHVADGKSRGLNIVEGHDNQYLGEVAGATIGGGGGWYLADSMGDSVTGSWATVCGGARNHSAGWSSSIGGGGRNRAFGSYTVIGGGGWNSAAGHGSTIGGGSENSTQGSGSTISGGWVNLASGHSSSVGGGSRNVASGDSSTVSGGTANMAEDSGSTVGGGHSNWAGGEFAVVPGGWDNSATGDNSLAAGRRARALNSGSFVWADNSVDENLQTTGDYQFLIRATGGVGIGTNAPASQLSVNGDLDISGKLGVAIDTPEANLHIDGANGAGQGIRLESYDDDLLNMYFTGATGFVIDNFRPSDSRRIPLLLQPAGGNVGVGTYTPGFTLEVNGDAAKPGGGSWSVASDRSLKDVEHTFNRGLEAIKDLRPVVYRYKKGNEAGLPSDASYIGLIAQDVEISIPEAVSTDDSGYLHVNNDPIIWTMLNAINELSEENERQRSQINELRHTIDDFDSRLAQIESQLQP